MRDAGQIFGTNAEQSAQAGPSERQAHCAGDGAQQQAFDQQLPQNARSRGAQGQAHGDFLAAAAGAGQQKIRDVDAADQQDEGGAGEQSDEGRSQVANYVALHGRYFHFCVLGREVGVEAADLRSHLVDVGLGLLEGHARLPALQHAEKVERAGALREIVFKGDEYTEVRGNVRILREVQLKIRRHDADHGGAFTQKRDAFSYNGRIGAEAALPESVGENDGGRAVELFILSEHAAEGRWHSQRLQKIGGNERDFHLLRVCLAGECAGADPNGGDILRQSAAMLDFGESRSRCWRAGGSGFKAGPDERELFWVNIGKRAQQDGVDDAEDGGVHADAERERQDGDQGESGAFAESARGVANVLQA